MDGISSYEMAILTGSDMLTCLLLIVGTINILFVISFREKQLRGKVKSEEDQWHFKRIINWLFHIIFVSVLLDMAVVTWLFWPFLNLPNLSPQIRFMGKAAYALLVASVVFGYWLILQSQKRNQQGLFEVTPSGISSKSPLFAPSISFSSVKKVSLECSVILAAFGSLRYQYDLVFTTIDPNSQETKVKKLHTNSYQYQIAKLFEALDNYPGQSQIEVTPELKGLMEAFKTAKEYLGVSLESGTIAKRANLKSEIVFLITTIKENLLFSLKAPTLRKVLNQLLVNDLRGAIRGFRKFYSQGLLKEDEEPLSIYAKLCYLIKDYPTAKEIFERLIKANPSNLEAKRYLKLTYEAMVDTFTAGKLSKTKETVYRSG
jgi:tetratricopeptide (TPR) repeat protein